MQRFGGKVEWLADVDVTAIVAWIATIALRDWPQQNKPSDPELKPAMVTDLLWHGFGSVTDPVVGALMDHFPSCVADQRMLSVVMPGHAIPAHVDRQPPHWRCRVHVPLLSNAASRFIVDDETHVLQIGAAYRVNTEAVHSVTNDGEGPRVHLMFDVRTH